MTMSPHNIVFLVLRLQKSDVTPLKWKSIHDGLDVDDD
jgi:hypothetical protein